MLISTIFTLKKINQTMYIQKERLIMMSSLKMYQAKRLMKTMLKVNINLPLTLNIVYESSNSRRAVSQEMNKKFKLISNEEKG